MDPNAPPVDLKDEARLLMEVRQELGAEYDEALVASLVDKVEESLGRGGRRAGDVPPPADRVKSRRAYLALGLIIVGACTLAINTASSRGSDGMWPLPWRRSAQEP